MEKNQGQRVKECVTLWRKLTVDLAIPSSFSGMDALKEAIDTYIKTGEEYRDEIEIPSIKRVAKVFFPKTADKSVEITLSVQKDE
jgi:alcohol dehydrogenase class IV